MTERPIIFTGQEVRAIIEGRKTQTRRIVKCDGLEWLEPCGNSVTGDCHMAGQDNAGNSVLVKCPFGKVGDRLWVRETWRVRGGTEYEYQKHQPSVVYRANAEMEPPTYGIGDKWRPSIHMPRWASRLTLEITAVRVERLQSINEEDAKAEGADRGLWDRSTMTLSSPADESDESYATHKAGFAFLWESIHGPGSWDANPWLWVIEFRKVEEGK